MLRRFLLLACLLSPLPVAAQSLLPDGVVSVQLLPGWRTAPDSHMAGLEISLAPGWKTYWRAPGDAGIPPDFHWSAGENVTGMNLHWPVPEVSHANGMRSIGYSGRVVIPMEFTTAGAGAARISGEVEIGVCSEVCVPVRLPLSADLPPEGNRAPKIIAALVDRPETADEAGIGRITCSLSPIRDGLEIEVAVEMPAMGGDEAVVIEAGDPAVWVSEPLAARHGDVLTARADLVHVSRGAFAVDRSQVRITVLGGQRAVDIRGCD